MKYAEFGDDLIGLLAVTVMVVTTFAAFVMSARMMLIMFLLMVAVMMPVIAPRVIPDTPAGRMGPVINRPRIAYDNDVLRIVPGIPADVVVKGSVPVQRHNLPRAVRLKTCCAIGGFYPPADADALGIFTAIITMRRLRGL